MFVDSHCHLNSQDFNSDREDCILRAHENNVNYILNVSDDISKTENLITFCQTT